VARDRGPVMSASSSRDGVACTAEAEAHAPLLEGHAEREALAELLVHGAEGHCRVLAQDRRSVCVAKGELAVRCPVL
jgi:hypothetical protein